MEYNKHINRLVLGYLKSKCKNAYKVFLKYNFQNHHKHIPTRVAGHTLEDILRIYSRVEEIVQGHLEQTNYYKESAEFSSPRYLDDQLIYLLEKNRPFTPSSTPCPRSPAESSVAESQHDNAYFPTNDIETTPEHTLPGNISSQEEDYQSKTPFRKVSKSPSFTTPFLEKLPISNKEASAEVITSKVPENNSAPLNTPDIACFPHKGENVKNKEGVGTELDDMLQHILGPGTPVNTVNKAIRSESTTSANSNNRTHATTPLRSWQAIDDHNNRAVSSILAAASIPNNEASNFVAATNDPMGYNDNLNRFQDQPVPSALQVTPAATNFPNNQYLLPTSVGMYIVPQPAMTAVQSSNQQQQFYIVNQPVCLPQQAPVMQLLQPLAPKNKAVVIHPNQTTPLIKDNNVALSEQDIMTMPTIILNERNEIAYADPGNFPVNTPLKENEVHNLKEYINLFGATDQSPVLKFRRGGQVKGYNTCQPVKPTPTIKVEIYQRECLPVGSGVGTSNTNNVETVSDQANIGRVGCTGLPNLNDTTETESAETTQADAAKLINKETSYATTDKSEIESHEKIKSRMVDTVCTPSPLETIVRKPTPKSNSHVRNLSFPSPKKRTSEKLDSKRSSPRIVNKQQAAKDLFRSESGEESKSDTKALKVTKHSTKNAKTPTKIAKRTPKRSRKASSKSPKKSSESEKAKSSKKTTTPEVVNENATLVEENISPKSCWDSNLRKLIPPIIEKSSTPLRRVSARKKTRPSLEHDACDIDGKKLEDALKTPNKNEKAKRKTPSRKKDTKILNTKKLEENRESHDNDTKSETKVLSPSKLNANKRNIVLNDVDDVTPNNLKDSSQYPISSKTRRNISSLLETPIKDDLISPTPGEVRDKTDTPFTPMLRANLKDFTEGSSYSINTPNFPITPGFVTMANTSAAYYILNDNESDKATEATVLLEEKKSSVRKSDDEDIELSPRVYGSKDILDNFNKVCVGKKNLELLDSRGVTWDGSSDREEKSHDNSENNSEDESNNTVIPNQKLEPPNEMKVLPTKSRGPGKCMATLQLLKEIKDQPEASYHDPEVGSPKEEGTKIQSDDEEPSAKDRQEAQKIAKMYSSGSESEVLSKKSYDMKNNISKSIQVVSTDSDSEPLSKLQDRLLKKGENVVEKKIEINRSNQNITQTRYTITTQEVLQTISEVCLEENAGLKLTTVSLQTQLEEKKKRWMELDKAKQPVGTRKTPARRATIKPPPKLNSERSTRKSQSAKTVLKSSQEQKETLHSKNANKKDVESHIKASEVVESDLGIDTDEYHPVDSQDEFFKRSGTNLHRKNKDAKNSIPESRKESDDDSSKAKRRGNLGADEVNHEDIKCTTKVDKEQDHQRILEDQLNNAVIAKNSKTSQYISTASNNPNEFEKSWQDCNTSAFESEQVVVYHDESKPPDMKLEDYDFSILQKKIVVGVPCSDGSIVNITLTASSFDTLLEIKPSDQCEMTDGSRDEVDKFETSELKPDAVSDSEHAGSKPDSTDFKCGKKRKHRSDSCNSNSSAKKMKTNEKEMLNGKEILLNQMNIDRVLAHLHGPQKTKESLD